MIQIKSKLIKWLAGLALCSALLAMTTTFGVAYATTTVDEADYTLVMSGASIRVDENYGIRFKATAKAVREDSKYYMMIVPKSWKTDEAHDLQNAEKGDYYKHLTEVKNLKPMEDFIVMQSMPEEKGGVYEIKGSLTNVHFTNSNTEFFGIAYEELADQETRNYATSQDKAVRSICWVAGAALNDESNEFSDKIIQNLKDTVNDAYDVSLGNKDDTGAELDLSSFGFKQNSVYTLDKGSVTSLEMTGVPEKIDLPIEYSVVAGSGIPATITEDGVLTVNDETGYSFVKAQIAGETRNLTVFNTPEMADGMLQDFASNNGSNRTYAMNIGDINATDQSVSARGYWEEEKEDAYGNKGYGVGRATMYNDVQSCALRLNASKAELKAMDIDTITIRFMATSAKTDVSKLSLVFFDVPSTQAGTSLYTQFPVNVWSYYTITKESIIARQTTGATEEEKWDAFLDMYCNTGVGRITGTNNGGCASYWTGGVITFYIDYISVGTQRMAEHELENFNVASNQISNHMISVMSFTNLNGNNSSLLETKADDYGKTALKVAKVTITSGAYGISVMRFAKTAEELTAILETLDSMTWRVMVNKDQTLNILGNAISLTANKWTDVMLTKAQLLAKFAGTTEAEKIATFASLFCSTGTALGTPRMFSVPSVDCPVDLYVDGVTYATATAK